MSTIKQKSAFVEIEGVKRVEVRRMKWKAARDFLKKFTDVMIRLYRDGKIGEAFGSTDLAARLSVFDRVLDVIPKLIQQSDELIEHVVTESTNLSPAEFNELEAVAAVEVLNAIMGLNCDEELKKSLAGIEAGIAVLMPARADQTTK